MPSSTARCPKSIPLAASVSGETGEGQAPYGRVGGSLIRRTHDAFEFTGEDIDVVREGDVDVVHWVPADGSLPVRMRTMDGDVTGLAEPGFAERDTGEVLQFERIGFVRVDDVSTGAASGDESVVYFAHP